MASHLFRTKSPDQLIAEAAAPERQMKRALGPFALTCIGIGAIIGTGIFALAGTAAAGEQFQASIWKTPVLNFIQAYFSHAPLVFGRPGAGPAVMLSFIVAGVACGFAALCYAELASMIPVSGSAYTYSYATLGELIAWIIGWDLILEYAVGNMAVAVGWSGYFVRLFGSLFGLKFPVWAVNDYGTAKTIVAQGGEALSNFSSATIPTIAGYPIALNLTSLRVMAAVITGMRKYTTYFGDPAAVATAFAGYPWAQALISAGALAGITSVLLVFQLGQPRIFMAMARDGLLPQYFAKIHPKFRTPHITTIWTGVFVGGIAAVVDIGSLADLTNIGTLFAFILVFLGFIVLRRTQPSRPRPFRVPFVPLFPILGVVFCFVLMLSLPLETWGRFVGWLVIGLIIYGCYGFWRSKLRNGIDTGITEDQPPPLIKP